MTCCLQQKKKETDNDNRGGEVRRDDLRAPAVDASIMQIEVTNVKMQLDKFLLTYDRQTSITVMFFFFLRLFNLLRFQIKYPFFYVY
jgi:hypothetical protein